MARIARVVLPGAPHLVTQRGEGNLAVFKNDEDRREYLRLLASSCERWSVKVWAYCLLPGRVLLVVAPQTQSGMARALGETHRRYAKGANLRDGREGKLWHARFSSCVLQPDWLPKAMRFVERAPVAEGLAARPEDFKWSSAPAHVGRADESAVVGREVPATGDVKWSKYLLASNEPAEEKAMTAAERTGRPLGSVEFVKGVESRLGRRLRPRKRGRKPKSGTASED